MRRSRQQHDDALAPVEFPAQPLPRCRSVRVRQNRRTLENVGLFGVVRRHLPAARGEAFFQALQNVGVSLQPESESFGYSFSCQIVFRRTQPTAEDDDIGTVERVLSCRDQAPLIVSDYALENHLRAKLVQLLGEVERIGIYAVGS